MEKKENINTLMACRYCPMCRHVCTVGNISFSESDFPRGKALILYSIFKRVKEYDEDIVNSIYNCCLCGRCVVNCEGEIYSIPELIKASRRNIVIAKKEPDAIKKIKKSLIENDNPYGISKEKGYDSSLKSKAKVLYYMGPDVNFKNHEIANAVIRILNHVKEDYTILKNEPDCGKILNLLGYIDDAKDKAKNLFTRIKSTGCDTIILSCPLCFDALKNDYPQWGFGLEPDIKIYHMSEYLYNLHIDRKIKLNKTNEKITIADSEYLTIFNNMFEYPRKLIESSAGHNFIEIKNDKRSILATGEAAFFFKGKTFNLGEELGEKICKIAKEAGVTKIATLSAAAKNNLKKYSDLEVVEISEFVNSLI